MPDWAVLRLEPLNISRLEEDRAGRGKQRFLGGLHGVSRVVWRRVASLCSLSHNILIVRALYCAKPAHFPAYLRKWTGCRISLVSSGLCFYLQFLSVIVYRILRCSIVRVIQLYQTILLYMPPLYKAVCSWVCVGFVAGVPEWEYSMFLYITFPFFGFHWRGLPCNLPLNFLE